MKISSVINICKKNKHVRIYNTHAETKLLEDGSEEIIYSGVQWISNGAAIYCLNGIPRIESENEFYKQYDVQEKQRESYFFSQDGLPGFIDLRPYTDDEYNEIMARPTAVTIGVDDTVLRGIEYDRQMFFVRDLYLEPFKKTADDALEFAVRHMENGRPYLYIREEMDAGAAVFPYIGRDNATWNNAADELRNIWNEITAEIQRDQEEKETTT